MKLGGRLSKGLLSLALVFAAFFVASANTFAVGLPFQVTEHPVGATYYLNNPATPLQAKFYYSYSAGNGIVSDAAPIRVQWFKSTVNSQTDRSNGFGMTAVGYSRDITHTSTHIPATNVVGVWYYYAVITYDEFVSTGPAEGYNAPRETITSTARIEVLDPGNRDDGGSSGTGNNPGGSSSSSTETNNDDVGDETEDDAVDEAGDVIAPGRGADDEAIGDGGGDAWALLNLILMGIGILAVLAVLFRIIITKKKLHIVWVVLTGIFAVGGVVLFILTEDMTKPMVVVDFWTIFQAIIAVLCVAAAVMCFLGKKKESDKKEGEEKKEGAEKKEDSDKKEDEK